ncbi:aldehyde dehydrogenase family protein [Alkalinema pantanalense CENA528]|uniref:aldehyde dehydrogenase family protein n=1 Tax=Alkalinema pantanalense TaxID=1620705 RepID=UPI003D6DDD0D
MLVPSMEFSSPQPQPTAPDVLDRTLHQLTQHKQDWLNISISQRITYLKQCLATLDRIAESWATASCQAKGLDPNAAIAGEEWIAGPLGTAMGLRSLITTLQTWQSGQPRSPCLRQYQGQAIAQVFPENSMERLLLLGYRGEVWLDPDRPPSQGKIYRQPSTPEQLGSQTPSDNRPPASGQLCLVLGAGNLSCIAPLDAIHQLFAENHTVLLKMNPVNAYIGPFLEQVFAPLITDGFLAIVYGGAETGAYLCQHPAIDTIHITGSETTHDKIVWGEHPEQQKATGQPKLNKPISSELGGVTPILVVPGHWSRSDLQFQARHIASMVAHNGSFDCVAGKVLVLAQDWPQREEFLTLLHQTLAQTPTRKAYYPGAQARHQAFCAAYPQHQVLSDPTAPQPPPDHLPWTILPNIPAQAGEYALTQEAFCGVLAEVTIAARTAAEFLSAAVDFVNHHVAGNLGCMVLIDPRTQRQSSAELEAAIATLQYGVIGINAWAGAAFIFAGLAWGAFPGNSLHQIQSGQGFVHNTYLLDHPQKSVLRLPFRPLALPTWFVDHRTLKATAQAFLKLTVDPSWLRFLQVAIVGLQG